MDKEAAKSKLMRALAGKIQPAKKGISELLYGKRPASVSGSSLSGAATGRSIAKIVKMVTGRDGLSRPGAAIGGLVGGIRGQRRLAAYQARRTNVNRGLAGAGLAGLGAMALKSSKSRD